MKPSPSLSSELRETVALATPIALGQAGLALMGIVDTAVVGRLGTGPLGAVGLANGLFFAVAVIGIGTMMGLDPLIAQALGAKDERRARELFWQGMWLGLAATAVLALPILAAPSLLGPFGIAPDVASDARAFLLMRLFGLAPMFWFVGVRSYLQAVGRVHSLVAATVIANVLNLFGDILFVYGGAGLPAWLGPLRQVPAFGAAGAGLTTSLCSVAQLGIVAWAASRVPFGAAKPGRRLHAPDLWRACRVGVPVGLQMCAEVGVFALAALLAGGFGTESLAAHNVALQLASFTFSATVGIGTAGTVRVGRAIGARDRGARRRAGFTAFATGAGFMSCAALAFWLVPAPIIRLFNHDPAVLAVGVPLLGVAAVFQLSDGVQAVGAGVLRGAGDTRFAFVANVIGHYGIGLPLSLALGIAAHQGIIGVWWGLCAGLTAVAAALLGRFWFTSRREIAPLEGPLPPAPEEVPLAPLVAPPLPPEA